MNDSKLLAIRAGRRAIGLAVFSGLTLECTFFRELTATAHSAEASTRAFVRWILETFPAESVLVEAPVTKASTRAQKLRQAVLDELAAVYTSVDAASAPDVFARRDRPHPLPRRQLRALAATLWPQLFGRACNPVCLDAAVLGLYAQTTELLTP
jgi:hypothetical protein